jgi:uncharacterized protein YidB (DUF937 family)
VFDFKFKDSQKGSAVNACSSCQENIASPYRILGYGFLKTKSNNKLKEDKTMGLLDSILGAVSGKTEGSGGANALVGVLGGLLQQSGGLQGLANKFSQGGCGNVFSSWVGLGENQSISSDQIQSCLGSDQVKALAAKMGIDPAQASNLLAEFLPKVVDKLTPTGKVDPNADHQQGLAALIPSLLQTFAGSDTART